MYDKEKIDFIISNHILPFLNRCLVIYQIVRFVWTRSKNKKVEIVYKMILNNFIIDKWTLSLLKVIILLRHEVFINKIYFYMLSI